MKETVSIKKGKRSKKLVKVAKWRLKVEEAESKEEKSVSESVLLRRKYQGGKRNL